MRGRFCHFCGAKLIEVESDIFDTVTGKKRKSSRCPNEGKGVKPEFPSYLCWGLSLFVLLSSVSLYEKVPLWKIGVLTITCFLMMGLGFWIWYNNSKYKHTNGVPIL